ncbi:MAG: hypothetical protein QOE75_1104 [Solirubrobacterales bacterium]|jgi:hypothetical protein|nr:hypothetical protein [Solirubrobacterales bacterium]
MRKSFVLLVALFALALPASALAAPLEGPGTVTIAPDPLVVPATTVGYQGEWLTVDVSYEGDGEAGVEKIALSGGEASEFSADGDSCEVLQSGQHCTARFALKPSSLGEKQATIEVTFQNGRPAEQRPISGHAVPPQLTFSPPAHDFGIVRVNRESAEAFMQVTNSGEAPVQVFNFDVQGDTSVFSHGSSSCSLLLAPGQSCSVRVYFSPYDQVDYQAELRASTGGEHFSATLSGRGGRSVIGPASNPVDFGAATVGSKVVRTITLTNSGDLPGAFFIAVIAGGDVGSFRLLSESCTMIELQPAHSCTVRVRFEPQEPGPLSARFAMFGDSDDGTMVFLEGAGLPAPAAGAESPRAEDAVASQRKVRKKRFGRNKGIHAPNLRPARRSELRAGAARR